MEKKLAGLKAEKQRLAGPMEEEQRLKALLEQIIDQKNYIENRLLQDNIRTLRMLAAVSKLIPRDVVLDSIRQERHGKFTIEGSSSSQESITRFNDSLSMLEYCDATILENVSRSKKTKGAREKIFPYSFSITVTDEPAAGLSSSTKNSGG